MTEEAVGVFEPGPGGPYNGIYSGNAYDLMNEIPDNSVDMVFCDPVYSDAEQYLWLARESARVLKEDTALLAFSGGRDTASLQIAMEKYMRWVWNLKYVVQAKGARLRGYNLFLWTTDVLWFAKGNGYPKRGIPDTYISSGSAHWHYKWNKNVGVYEYYLTAFTEPGALILDPFCGSGSLPVACKRSGRRYIGFEIKPELAQEARVRIADTPLPLLMRNSDTWQYALGVS